MITRRIALFGGTFDPIHLGHIRVACAAAEYMRAEKVVFVPAKRSPLKPASPMAGDEERLEMIRLAIEGKEKFEASDVELKGPVPSYTIETVRHFKELYGSQVELHWLIGADSLGELAHWYEVEQIIDECCVSLMLRAGYDRPSFERYIDLWGPERIEKLKRNVIPTPMVDISSTGIRSALLRGDDVSEMLDAGVVRYICERNLYGRATED